MKLPTHRIAAALLAACCFATSAQTVDDFPNQRPISLIVGFGTGGSTDILARLLTPALKAQFGQTVVVDNRPGASGTLAAEALVRAPADGYTLIACTNSILTTHQYLFKNLPFDAGRDILPVSQVVAIPYVLLVHPKWNVDTAQAFVALAQSRPNDFSYGSAGQGSANHLAGAMFASTLGIQMTHVPYRGSGQMISDLVAGHLDLAFDQEATVKGFLADGRLKALAIASPQRSPTMPGVPTFNEVGLPFEAAAWTGICVRTGTPEPIVRKIGDAVRNVLAQADIRARIVQLGMLPKGSTAEAFQTLVQDDSRRLGAAIQALGITVQ